jgi:uncharacterized protein YggE
MTQDTRGITVTGRGEVLAPPDLATVEIGVSVLGPTVSGAAAEAASSAQAVIHSLTGNGVEQREIGTANYSIAPEYDWRENERRLLGYRVSNTVRARIEDLTRVGPIIDGVTTAGGDSILINSLQFSIDDDTEPLGAAREAAWADARAKAEHLARLAGRGLGQVVTIAESGFGPPGPIPMPRFSMAAAAEDMSTPIEGGSSAVVVSLHVRFDLD